MDYLVFLPKTTSNAALQIRSAFVGMVGSGFVHSSE